MKFKNLKSIIEYIPNCIICGKTNNIYIDNYTYKKSIKVKIEDNYLTSKKDGLCIDILTNKYISQPKKFILDKEEKIFLEKKCHTCRFTLTFNNAFLSENNDYVYKSSLDYFPELQLVEESIYYSNKPKIKLSTINNIISITNSYNAYDDKIMTSLSYEDKYNLLPHAFNFSKIRDFKHLKSKVNTFLTFK